MRGLAFSFVGLIVAASCGGKINDGSDAGDGGHGDDVSVSGQCCPPSAQPNCCMSFGGWSEGGCKTVCDGMPTPNEPGWHQATDSHGCLAWVAPTNATNICFQKPPPPDAGGACPPASVNAWSPQIDPPFFDHAGACSAQLIADIDAACFSSSPTSQCQTLMTQNPKCQACLITPRTSSTWGALIALGSGTIELDVAGCLSNLGNASCAQSASDLGQCEDASCGQCQVTDQQSLNDYVQCVQTADATGCAKFVAAQCAGLDAGAYAQCYPVDFQSGFMTYATLFCGP